MSPTALIKVFGSVHTSDAVLQPLKAFRPSIVCVETCMNRLSFIQRSRSYESFRDLKIVSEYCHQNRIPFKPIDQSIFVTSAKFWKDVHAKRATFDVIRYIALNPLMQRLTAELVELELRALARGMIPQVGLSRSLCDSWFLPRELYDQMMNICRQSGQLTEAYELAKEYLVADQKGTAESSESRSNPFELTVPRAYHKLCNATRMHDILYQRIIKDRDRVMANRVREIARSAQAESRIAVVVGENHVRGIEGYLSQGFTHVVHPRDREEIYTPTITEQIKVKLLERLLG